MKILVVYDSMYGNTERIARAIAGAVEGEVMIKSASQMVVADIEKIDLLFIGSPTQAGRYLKPMQAFLDSLAESALKGLRAGVFDTRMTGNFPRLFGWAANKIADALKKKGALLLVAPEGFFVKGIKGPLADGELERAAAWAKLTENALTRVRP